MGCHVPNIIGSMWGMWINSLKYCTLWSAPSSPNTPTVARYVPLRSHFANDIALTCKTRTSERGMLVRTTPIDLSVACLRHTTSCGDLLRHRHDHAFLISTVFAQRCCSASGLGQSSVEMRLQ